MTQGITRPGEANTGAEIGRSDHGQDSAEHGIGACWRRRGEAARRLVGGDPWPVRDQLPAPEFRELQAWQAAVKHVAADRVTPIIPPEIARSLWRQGGESRAVAEWLWRAGGFAA
ncbi:hypothetical protein ACQP0C_02515 [Nocardia sp. CA-129566]|uniref:hypothetical protein n=1 Tax=Nocardia sp. CA-129566 TaxID=3239976 RepID=UPI003D973015